MLGLLSRYLHIFYSFFLYEVKFEWEENRCLLFKTFQIEICSSILNRLDPVFKSCLQIYVYAIDFRCNYHYIEFILFKKSDYPNRDPNSECRVKGVYKHCLSCLKGNVHFTERLSRAPS